MDAALQDLEANLINHQLISSSIKNALVTGLELQNVLMEIPVLFHLLTFGISPLLWSTCCGILLTFFLLIIPPAQLLLPEEIKLIKEE